jgi:murein DD-endopeptidase MepM/ murein hydrolase activator NlpD
MRPLGDGHWLASIVFAGGLFAACSGGGNENPAVSPTATAPATAIATNTPSPTVEPPATATPTSAPPASPTPLPTATAPVAALEPVGLPLPADAVTGVVRLEGGMRVLHWGEGATVFEVSRDQHPSGDPWVANSSGWNCRLHVEYEGSPAVDWYVPVGTPVYATMDGEAMLLVNTLANAFDWYGVSREPFLGDPDRASAPLSPFPGPGGGQGVFVRLRNADYSVDFGHLEIGATVEVVPAGAFVSGYGRDFPYAETFAAPRVFTTADVIATWQVRRGDLIGYTGDAGYSEAPHLHYAITRVADGARLCPSTEAGFADGGWVLR